jgi:aldose 1-epimerase
MSNVFTDSSRTRVAATLSFAAVLAIVINLTGVAPSQASRASQAPTITVQPFGAVNGTPVSLYVLTNSRDMQVKITNYGGIIQSIWVPDRHGQLANVALGFPTVT